MIASVRDQTDKPQPTTADKRREPSGTMHIHTTGNGFFKGNVYIGGDHQGWTETYRSVEAVEQAAVEKYGPGLEVLVWSQDDGMILF